MDSRPAAQASDAIADDPAPAPVASIIVLGWRVADGLRACLASLAASDAPPPFEVVVVLNGADDAVRAVAQEHADRIKIVDIPLNVGYGAGCNAAARRARGRYLVFLNDDAVVDPGWLRALVDAAESDPGLGAIGGLVLEPDGAVQEVGCRIMSDGQPLPAGHGLDVEDARMAGLLERRAVDYASGAALLVPQKVFEQVGGFDPLFRPAYYEDVDLCFRIRRGGWDCVVEPTAVVRHAAGSSTRSDIYFREFAIEHAREAFRRRWAATLEAAPDPDAALTELCDPRHDDPVVDRSATTDPVQITLDVGADYQAWLSARLAAADAVLTRDLPRLAVLEHEVADLRTRGPLGFLKWKLGNRRRARMAAAGA